MRVFTRQKRESAAKLLALLVTCGATCGSRSGSRSSSDCFSHAPHFLTLDQRSSLCQKETTSAPALCAKEARKASHLSGPQIVQLCYDAASDMPGVCVSSFSKRASKWLSAELSVSLCHGAISEAPARCMERCIKSKRPSSVAVEVCRGARSMGPADCLNLLPQAVADEAASRLCNHARTDGPAICATLRGLVRYGPDVITTLCRDAVDQQPAECFRRSGLTTKLSPDEGATLCQDARSDAPARCVEEVRRDRHLNSTARVALCRGAVDMTPALCVAAIPATIPCDDRVMLCRGATAANPAAPAICFKRVSQDVLPTTAVGLCSGAGDSAVADCAKSARHVVGDSSYLVQLCKQTTSVNSAHCAKAAHRAGADGLLAAQMCSRSRTLEPASCFAAAPAEIAASVRAEACAGARSIGPARCLSASMPRSIQAQGDAAVCPLDRTTPRMPRRGLDHRLAGRLCRDAPDENPAACGRAAPRRMSDGDVVNLCEAAAVPAGESTAKCASMALMHGINVSNAALLCRGARTNAPASCAAMVSPYLGETIRVTVCSNATSVAPARCVNSLAHTKAPTSAEIDNCRMEHPRSSGLRVTSLGFDGEYLYPDQPMHATLEILDQWGGQLPSDSSTTVRASVAARGSNGAFVNVQGRQNCSSSGVVHFSQISFSDSGALTLHFSISNYGEAAQPLAAARVIVAETEQSASERRCAYLYSILCCPSHFTSRATSELNGDCDQSMSVEAVSVVSGGTAAAFYVMSCQNIFEQNGVRVAFTAGDSNPFMAWIWYHPGIVMLETGVGLPTSGQPAWEMLGISQHARGSEVRRAYHRQSLLWHPDRWVRYAAYAGRAQEVFEKISEAYKGLTGEGRAKRM